MILTNQQIDKRVVRLIRQQYSLDAEQKLSRISHGAAMRTYELSTDEMAEIADYQAHVEACRDLGRQMVIDSANEAKQQAYDRAVARLRKVILEEGRKEQKIPPVYKEGYGDLPEDERPILEEGYTIKFVEPVEPLMIEQVIYDDEGNQTGVTEIVNPIIQSDRNERAAAQIIVDTGL